MIGKKIRTNNIGEPERKLKTHFSEQKGYNHNLNQATGAHFNLLGYSSVDMQITILEKVKINNSACRKEREKYHINFLQLTDKIEQKVYYTV